MTHLRKMMLEELQRRNYAETTISSYIRIVEDIVRAAGDTFIERNRNWLRWIKSATLVQSSKDHSQQRT